MADITKPFSYAKQRFENGVVSVMRKFGYASAGTRMGRGRRPEPPYERQVPPRWIYQMRRKNALINNAIEEKVNQTFRRGLTNWEKEYIARCPECDTEYDSPERFRSQLGDAADDLEEEDFDFSTERPCPTCGLMVEMDTPNKWEKERAQSFLEQVNARGQTDQFLDGDRQNSVGQTFVEVCKEVSWDIQSFDDGWMIFERDYILNENGEIEDWELKEVHRGPPELMRYSVNDDSGEIGTKYWICPKCRATDEHYQPQKNGTRCQQCDAKTYRAYVEMLNEPGGKPQEWYIRGEFAHASEYEPSKFYGLSPIITLWEEARTLEQMDMWYKEAYEERRAPRGAMVVRSSNAESVRSWNQQQMEQLKNDPQHVATFIDDTDGKAQPITWQPLLEEPAQMQHMQMREWFMDRISAKYGVTSIFQSASPENSGLSQSMEIIVSNRSAMRLQQVFNTVFLPALVSQLQLEGWTIEVEPPEEEDEMAEADRIGKELKNAQTAQQVGAQVEWTPQDAIDVKPGMLEPPEEEGGGGMADMMGGGGGDDGGGGGSGSVQDMLPGGGGGGAGGAGSSGPTGPSGGRPVESNATGGEPRSRPEPTQGNEIQAADDALTTDDGGASNATYSGRRGGVINIFDHIREMLADETSNKMRKRLFTQAKTAFDKNYQPLGLNGDTIEEYALSDEKNFYDLCEAHYGKWMKYPMARDAAEDLYNLFEANQR